MTSRNKKYILSGIGIVAFATVALLMFRTQKIQTKIDSRDCSPVRLANATISPSSKLSDKNDVHVYYAMKNGLKQPFSTDQEFEDAKVEMQRNSLLVEVVPNRYYQLKSLTHSQPYLIPEAVDMLNEIGYRFQERLKEKKYKNFRFRITSLLRTEEGQNKLSHRNSNATGHSSHLYGTTVDISYKNFYNTQTDSIESSFEAVQALTSVLLQMREECKFLAVRERKQSCFHITVAVCRPLN